jgi:hypothetical protein
MKKAWSSWVRIVKIIISVQTTIVFFVIYYLIIIPLGIALKLLSRDSLAGHDYALKKDSLWVSKPKIKRNIIWARAQ